MTSETANPAEPARLQEERYSPFLRVTFRRWTKWYLEGTETFWPFSDIVIRFFIAMWFLRSGLVKAADWDKALLLATQEYPVTWMSPANAAMTGLAIELIGPILLIAGLFTRPASLAMAALTRASTAARSSVEWTKVAPVLNVLTSCKSASVSATVSCRSIPAKSAVRFMVTR